MLQKKQVTFFDFDFKACMCYVSEALSWISCCKTFYTFCKADFFYQRLSLHVLLLPLQVPMNSTLPRRFRNLQTIYQATPPQPPPQKKQTKKTHNNTHNPKHTNQPTNKQRTTPPPPKKKEATKHTHTHNKQTKIKPPETLLLLIFRFYFL